MGTLPPPPPSPRSGPATRLTVPPTGRPPVAPVSAPTMVRSNGSVVRVRRRSGGVDLPELHIENKRADDETPTRGVLKNVALTAIAAAAIAFAGVAVVHGTRSAPRPQVATVTSAPSVTARSTGKTAHLGVSLQPGQNGATVTAVQPGTPAATAGIQVGDIVSMVDSQPVPAPADVIMAVHSHRPGDTARLSVSRNGRTVAISAVLDGA